MFVNYAYMLTINNLSLISNKFKRTGAIAEFKLQNVILESPEILTNSGDSILLFDVMNNMVQIDFQSPTFSSNFVR